MVICNYASGVVDEAWEVAGFPPLWPRHTTLCPFCVVYGRDRVYDHVLKKG